MAKPEDEILPEGVELYDFEDHEAHRRRIYDGIKEEMVSAFPQTYGGVRMDVEEVDYEGKDHFTLTEQKQALLEDKPLYRRLRGTLVLRDEASGDELDRKRVSLMRVPHLTERGTFINGGNEYTSIAQQRLLPGAYTRRQNNGDLETQFNVKPGSGTDFRVGFEPATGQYRLRVGQSNLHLYSLLKDMGIPDEELASRWGKELLEANRAKYDSRVFDKAYGKFVYKYHQDPQASVEVKRKAIQEALDGYKIHARVARKHLPSLYERTKAAEWRAQAAGRDVAEVKADIFDPDLSPDEAWDAAHTVDGLDKIAATDIESLRQEGGDE